jgi:hypothetical protein
VIPPFVQQIIGVIVRVSIVWLAGKFGANLSDDEAVKYAAEIAPVLAVLAWSIYQKYRGRLKLLTAQVAPAGKTEQQIESMVNSGQAPPVNTPKDRVPA